MSKLATVVGALSALVSLADYLFARSFLSHWLSRQFEHGADGWRISPVLNLIVLVSLVALIWLVTESSAAEPETRKRNLRLRANLLVACLAAWFVFGPTIGEIDAPQPPPDAAAPTASAPRAASPADGALDPASGPPPNGLPASRGVTSQYTWKRPAEADADRYWRPGAGLRAMAQMLENAAATPQR